MYRTIPKMSKIIEGRMAEREENRLKESLKNPKGTMKTNLSRTQSQLKTAPGFPQVSTISGGGYIKTKREYIEDERNREIQRNNMILFDKMTSIFNKTNQQFKTAHKIELDGLHKPKRKRDLIKITMENESLMKRIASQKSAYNVKKFETDFAQSQQYAVRICERPVALDTMTYFNPSSKVVKGRSRDDLSLRSQEAFYNKDKNSATLKPINGAKEPATYKTSHKIGEQNMVIQISIQNSCVNIKIDNPVIYQTFQTEITQQDSASLLKQIENSLAEIIPLISLENNQIVVRDRQGQQLLTSPVDAAAVVSTEPAPIKRQTTQEGANRAPSVHFEDQKPEKEAVENNEANEAREPEKQQQEEIPESPMKTVKGDEKDEQSIQESPAKKIHDSGEVIDEVGQPMPNDSIVTNKQNQGGPIAESIDMRGSNVVVKDDLQVEGNGISESIKIEQAKPEEKDAVVA